MPRLA